MSESYSEDNALLEQLRGGDKSAETIAAFNTVKNDLGYGLLLKKYTTDVRNATPEMIDRAMHDTVPRVTPMFWSFRIMGGLGFATLLTLLAVPCLYLLLMKVRPEETA